PHTGFEPVVSALRGRCPGPLDECGRRPIRRLFLGLRTGGDHTSGLSEPPRNGGRCTRPEMASDRQEMAADAGWLECCFAGRDNGRAEAHGGSESTHQAEHFDRKGEFWFSRWDKPTHGARSCAPCPVRRNAP